MFLVKLFLHEIIMLNIFKVFVFVYIYSYFRKILDYT